LITEAQFRAIFPSCANPALWAGAVSRAFDEFGFTTVNQQAGYFGICGNETGGFLAVRQENTAWSAQQMVDLFSVEPTVAVTLAQQSPEARANYCYAHANGNRGEASGDGWRYRGAGIVQLTGRGNFVAAGTALSIDLVGHPEFALEPVTAARIAAWFMSRAVHILPQLDQGGETAFLDGARRVGAVNKEGKRRRLAYRHTALFVLSQSTVSGQPAPVPVASGTAAHTAPPKPSLWRAILNAIFGSKA
jgi:putative chitinase